MHPWQQEAADLDSFVPSWRSSEPRFGLSSEFPDSFSRQFVNRGHSPLTLLGALSANAPLGKHA